MMIAGKASPENWGASLRTPPSILIRCSTARSWSHRTWVMNDPEIVTDALPKGGRLGLGVSLTRLPGTSHAPCFEPPPADGSQAPDQPPSANRTREHPGRA